MSKIPKEMGMDVIKGKDGGPALAKRVLTGSQFGGSRLGGKRKCMGLVGTRVRG